RRRNRPADAASQRRRRLPPPHRKTPPVEATAMTEPRPLPAPITGDVLATRIAAVRDEVSRAFIGQADVLDQVLVALLAGGHVLVEGVPGLGKTLLVRALAQALGCDFSRVQDRKSTRLNSSHGKSSYAVFCLKKTR